MKHCFLITIMSAYFACFNDICGVLDAGCGRERIYSGPVSA